MKFLKDLFRLRWVQVGVALLFVAGVVGCVVAWRMGLGLGDLKAGWAVVEEYLKNRPLVLFGALVLLPGLPVPTSALMLTAGVVWRGQPVTACLLCLFALVLNLTWTYWLAAGPGRQLVEKLLAAVRVKVPELPKGNELKLILILKLTPGIPLFLQNYLLGFLRAPFHLYLGVSLLGNGLVSLGVVLSGAGLADGRLMPALTGVFLIVVGAVLTSLVRGWLQRRKKAVD